MDQSPYGGFLKWGYPQIIVHVNVMFHCKPSSYWGTPMTMETPIAIYRNIHQHVSTVCFTSGGTPS